MLRKMTLTLPILLLPFNNFIGISTAVNTFLSPSAPIASFSTSTTRFGRKVSLLVRTNDSQWSKNNYSKNHHPNQHHNHHHHHHRIKYNNNPPFVGFGTSSGSFNDVTVSWWIQQQNHQHQNKHQQDQNNSMNTNRYHRRVTTTFVQNKFTIHESFSAFQMYKSSSSLLRAPAIQRQRQIQKQRQQLVHNALFSSSSLASSPTFSSSSSCSSLSMQLIDDPNSKYDTTTTTLTPCEDHNGLENDDVSAQKGKDQRLLQDLKLYQKEIKRQMRLIRRIERRNTTAISLCTTRTTPNNNNNEKNNDDDDSRSSNVETTTNTHITNTNTSTTSSTNNYNKNSWSSNPKYGNNCIHNETNFEETNATVEQEEEEKGLALLMRGFEFEKKFEFSSNPRFDEQFYIDVTNNDTINEEKNMEGNNNVDTNNNNTNRIQKKEKYRYLHHTFTEKKKHMYNNRHRAYDTTTNNDNKQEVNYYSSSTSTTTSSVENDDDDNNNNKSDNNSNNSNSMSSAKRIILFNELIEKESQNDKCISDLMKQYNDALLTQIEPSIVQQCIEILCPYVAPERIVKIESILQQRTKHTRFLFENPVNPSNVYACLRTLDAFGIQNVDIVLDKNQYIGKAALSQKRGSMRTAAGSGQWLTINTHLSTKAAIDAIRKTSLSKTAKTRTTTAATATMDDVHQRQQCRKQAEYHLKNQQTCNGNGGNSDPCIDRASCDGDGSDGGNVLFYASDLNPSSRDIRTIQWGTTRSVWRKDDQHDVNNNVEGHCESYLDDPIICIVMGNEERGISDEMRENVDCTFTLPMVGFAESFNLSVATAITLAHLSAQSTSSTSLLPSSNDGYTTTTSTGPIRPGDLDIDTYNCLLLKGLINSVSQKRIIRPLLKRNKIVLPSEIMNLLI